MINSDLSRSAKTSSRIDGSDPSGVVVRFAPSPTGMLHLGGVRTALFNWLFARKHGGVYLVRIEDTDRARSTEEAVKVIVDGLEQLGLSPDQPYVFQSSRRERHRVVVDFLLQHGKAYRCYCTDEELHDMRKAMQQGATPRAYMDIWRDRAAPDNPQQSHTIRLKIDRQREQTFVQDKVQGEISFPTEQLDDFVLLRSNGDPTYMAASVIDDADMGVTHVIRGVDHLTNAARHQHLLWAMGKSLPIFAHLPLIHGADGRKLSKRHGSESVRDVLSEGFVVEALITYLLCMGWRSFDAVVCLSDIVQDFQLADVSRSPAQFDFDKLRFLNAQAIQKMDENALFNQLSPWILDDFSPPHLLSFQRALRFVKQRTGTLPEIVEQGDFFLKRPTLNTQTAPPSTAEILMGAFTDSLLRWLDDGVKNPDLSTTNPLARALEENALKIKVVGKPLRWALTGKTQSAGGLTEIIEALGLQETRDRLKLARNAFSTDKECASYLKENPMK